MIEDLDLNDKISRFWFSERLLFIKRDSVNENYKTLNENKPVNLCTHNSNNYNFGEQKSAAERRGHEKTRKPWTYYFKYLFSGKYCPKEKPWSVDYGRLCCSSAIRSKECPLPNGILTRSDPQECCMEGSKCVAENGCLTAQNITGLL